MTYAKDYHTAMTSSMKKILGFNPEENIPDRANYFLDATPVEEKQKRWEAEVELNAKMGLYLTNNRGNFLINHRDQFTWDLQSIIEFLDEKRVRGNDNAPSGLMKLQMLSIAFNRSDMMGLTHYPAEQINRWVRSNKSKFMGCKGGLSQDEYDNLCEHSYVYINNFYKFDDCDEEEGGMNEYVWNECMTEEDKKNFVDKKDNMLWFWMREF